MTVGERIAQKRKENNLSMEELGRMLGVGKSAINKWEKGIVGSIKRDKIIQMAKIFDCDPAWLGGYKEENNSQNNEPKDTAESILIREIYTIFSPEELENPIMAKQIAEILKFFKALDTQGRDALLNFSQTLRFHS